MELAEARLLSENRYGSAVSAASNDELCELCREGKLFAVEAWFKGGGQPELSAKHQRNWAMGIAIERGFHSLVEVLLKNGFPADGKTVSACGRILAPLPGTIAFYDKLLGLDKMRASLPCGKEACQLPNCQRLLKPHDDRPIHQAVWMPKNRKPSQPDATHGVAKEWQSELQNWHAFSEGRQGFSH